MRIVIDLQSCQTEGSRTRGIGRYSTDLTMAIAAQAEDRDIWLALNGTFVDSITQIKQKFSPYIPSERMLIYEVPNAIGMLEAGNSWRRQAAERIREFSIKNIDPDVAHISSLFEGLGDNAATALKTFDTTTPTAVTLYDLIPFIRPKTYLDDAKVRTWYHTKIDFLKKADLLLAISESSRLEALEFLSIHPDKVVTVSTAVGDHFKPASLSPEQIHTLQNRYGLNQPFVMYTGGIDVRKNIEGLIEAYSQLPSDVRDSHQLAIVCAMRPHERNRMRAIASRHQLADDEIVLTGFVPEEDLVALYSLCELFVFPSFHEGFGLPALEAMCCGAVVMGANNSSIPEVIGRRDALFDSNQVEDVTQAIYRGLSDQGFRQSFREFAKQQSAKFSWQASAKKTLEAYDYLYDQRQSQQSIQVQVPAHTPDFPKDDTSTFQPKLAFVSPFPPEQSGIAEYSADLLPDLAKHYQVTVIVDEVEPVREFAQAAVAIESIDWFREHATQFERRLYHFGNSSLHHHMFDLLERYPGIVVLHDFYLSGALNWMDTFKGPPGILTRMLYHSHGYSALLSRFREDLETVVTKYPGNKSVLENAATTIVHSQHSCSLAKKWYGEQSSQDWHVVPQHHTLAASVTEQEARTQLGFKADDFVVCAFGIVAPTKLNDKLLNAWLASRLCQNSRCYLIFVGSNNKEDYGQQLKVTIEKNGLDNNVRITGFVSTQVYRQYLAAADVAVQLRTLSRGETSRAALEVLTYQLPLVINAHGSMAEYPDDVVIKLPDSFSDRQLASTLERLYDNLELRQSLGQAGYRYVTEKHSPSYVASRYRDVIEQFMQDSPFRRYQNLLTALKEVESEEKHQQGDLAAAANAIARNTQRLGKPQMLVDISSWKNRALDARAQKVVKASLIQLLKQPTDKYRVEPIYFDRKIYRYARASTLKLLGLTLVSGLEDTPVDISPKDIFVGLATEKVLAIESWRQIQKWHHMDVAIYPTILTPTELQQLKSPPDRRRANKQSRREVERATLTAELFKLSRHVLCTSPESAKQIEAQQHEIEGTVQQPDILILDYDQSSSPHIIDFSVIM